MASAAGLQNFLRTLSGAVATSVVQTSWENKTSYNHAELVGLVDRSGEAARNLAGSGMSEGAVRTTLDKVTHHVGLGLRRAELRPDLDG